MKQRGCDYCSMHCNVLHIKVILFPELKKGQKTNETVLQIILVLQLQYMLYLAKWTELCSCSPTTILCIKHVESGNVLHTPAHFESNQILKCKFVFSSVIQDKGTLILPCVQPMRGGFLQWYSSGTLWRGLQGFIMYLTVQL